MTKKKKKKQVRKKLCEANFPQTQVEGMNTTTSENKFDSKGVNTNLKDRNQKGNKNQREKTSKFKTLTQKDKLK